MRVVLRGDSARLGEVRARDVARVLTGLEAALAAAAYNALGRPRRAAVGRREAAVEAAARLHFVNVQPGSVATTLALPNLAEQGEAGLQFGVDDLAGAAYDHLVAAFSAPDEEVDRGLARALAELAESLGIGERHQELVLESERTSRPVRLGEVERARMRRLAGARPRRQEDVLVGSLREADFDRQTARLHLATGETVTVSFPPALEDEIYQVLRGQALVEGLVTYDPNTSVARRVEVRAVASPEALPFDSGAFWNPLPSARDLSASMAASAALVEEGPSLLTADERRELVAALAELHDDA